MGPRPLFRVFGIPVSVDLWFFIGLFFFYTLSGGGKSGLYTAIAVGIFVLIHELGHAVTARAFGAQVAIQLNFMVGWASYSHNEGLARWKRNLISLMGPLTQFVVGAVALAAARQWITTGDWDLIHYAIIWGGLVLAVLNLLPLWPLDGGHIVDSVIEQYFGLRGKRAFLIFTLAASAAILIFSFTQSNNSSSIHDWAYRQLVNGGLDPSNALLPSLGHVIIATPAIVLTSAYFVALFTALGSFQMLQVVNARLNGGVVPTRATQRAVVDDQTLSAVRSAERQGWSFGVPGDFPSGWVASPWLQAHLAMTSGAPIGDASQQLLGLAAPKQNWAVDRYDRPEIGRLLEHVPPMVANHPAVVAARVYQGPVELLISSALAAYHGDASAEGFYLIAEGLAERNDLDESMSWLVRAVQEHPDPRRVALSRPLNALHGRSDFQQLLGVAERAVAHQPGR